MYSGDITDDLNHVEVEVFLMLKICVILVFFSFSFCCPMNSGILYYDRAHAHFSQRKGHKD